MPLATNDELSQILADIGLNEYEKKAYLTILDSGVIVAKDISLISKIPYAKVYQTLDSLIDMGLIITDAGRPKKFIAQNPEIAIRNILLKMRDLWMRDHKIREDNFSKVIPYLQEMYLVTHDPMDDLGTVLSIHGITEIISRISNHVSSNIPIILTSNDRVIVNKIIPIIKGNPIIIRTSIDLGLDDSFGIKRINSVGVTSTMVIGDNTMFSIIPSNNGDYQAVMTQMPELVETYKIEIGLKE